MADTNTTTERSAIIEAMIEAGLTPEEAEDTQRAYERIMVAKRKAAYESRRIDAWEDERQKTLEHYALSHLGVPLACAECES